MGDREQAGQRPRTVVVVLLEQVQTLDAIGPLDVFAAANDNGARYHLRTVSRTGVRSAPRRGCG